LFDINFPAGAEIKTDFATGSGSDTTPSTDVTPTAESTPTTESTPTADGTTTDSTSTDTTAPPTVYHTIMTGKDLKQVQVTQDKLGQYVIQFDLTPEGASIFADFTAANVGKYLTIVLDGKVISSPVINSAIPDGSGIIQGSFTSETANALAEWYHPG